MDELLDELEVSRQLSPGERDRRRRLLVTAGIVGLAFVGIGQLTTGALFEDSATAAVSYATGNVAIEANGTATAVLPPAANMAPGDTVYRAIAVTNVGSLDLRYAITGETTAETKNLSQVLRYAVYSGVSAVQCAAGNLASGTAEATNLLVGSVPTPLLGSNATGADPGDRAVAAGAPADNLCVAVSLPIATTSIYASANASVTLTFDSEQTKNN